MASGPTGRWYARRMSVRAWFAAVGTAAVLLEAGAGAVALVQLGPARIALYPIACAVATAVAAVALWKLLDQQAGGPGGGEGGRGPAPRDDPSPPWWPAFESDLRRYADERSRLPAGSR